MKILVTPTSMQENSGSPALSRLRSFCETLAFNPTGKPLKEDELIPLLQDCDGYVAGLDFITEKVFAACPKLRAISRYGAGYDRVDLAAAARHHVVVTNTPGVNAQAVAELAMGLILCLARKIPMLDRSTKSGGWIRSTGVELSGRTMGIIGLGAIGKRLAACCGGFGMKLLAYDPYLDLPFCEAHGIGARSLEEILSESDVISLHLPLNAETRHLIDARAIDRMRDGVILINASRGAIVDEEAAYTALLSGKLAGLGLDAFEVEPPVGSPLLGLDTVVATPHTGAHTQEAVRNMQDLSVQNLMDVLSGQTCHYIVK